MSFRPGATGANVRRPQVMTSVLFRQRQASAVWLAIFGVLCLSDLGVASPRPDYGISSTIANSAKVKTIADNIVVEFDSVDEKVIQLDSGYTVLKTVKNALDDISSRVATAGKAVGTTISTLSTSKGPSIDAVFNPATAAIDSMTNLLTTGFTSSFATLETHISTFVTKEFRDSFKALVASLGKLRTALVTLKQGVQQVPGKTVPSKMTSDVLDGLYSVFSNVQVIRFTVTNTLNKLDLADKFIIDGVARAEKSILEVEASYDGYYGEITDSSTTLADSLSGTLGQGYGEQTTAIQAIQAGLEANTDYTTNFQPRIVSVEGLFGTESLASFNLDITDMFGKYLESIQIIDDDVMDFFGTDTCPVMKAMVYGLIVNGPNSLFCFEKYSYLAYNIFPSFTLLVSECYEKESIHLSSLFEAISPLVEMILFDVEDLADVLKVCLEVNANNQCFSVISPLYETLLTQTTTKRANVYQLMLRETDASIQRLSACYTAKKFFILIQVDNLISELKLCDNF